MLDGHMVDVEIDRFAGTLDLWRLDAVHLLGGCTRWQDTFAPEEEARAAFIAMVEAAGMAAFIGDRPQVRN
ncbi:MAG: hypothetical protein ABW003_09505 [Microvirga sp.]